MITSSICNPIPFVNENLGSYPNRLNTLHANLRHGNRLIIPYCHKFNKDDVVALQFSSTTNEARTLISYDGSTAIETIAIYYSHTVSGSEGTRYFYDYLVMLDSAYYDKIVTFKFTQSTNVLTSEPVYIYDLSDEIDAGTIKRIDYSNFDRIDSDLDGNLINWLFVPTADHLMFFYLDGIDLESNDKDESELLEGSINDQIISASLKPGIKFQTGAIPKHEVLRLKAVCALDFIAINEIEYLKNGSVEDQSFGNSTSRQATITLTEKKAININVDNIGYTTTDTVDWIVTVNRTGDLSAFDIEIPVNYMLHTIMAKHSSDSSMNQTTIIAGTTLGGTDYVSLLGGKIKLGTAPTRFIIHDQPSFTAASRLYVDITGSGVKLDFKIQFILNE